MLILMKLDAANRKKDTLITKPNLKWPIRSPDNTECLNYVKEVTPFDFSLS